MESRSLLEAHRHLVEQGRQVPEQPVAFVDGGVRKPVELGQRQPAVLEGPEHETAALGTEVAGKVMGFHLRAVRRLNRLHAGMQR
ncbi:MAG: hypothetical protein M5U12_35530 [Verrucomicrobia bacterium]|nr:hypothetical protein [Verrucomicrobiota bacterium]